jgi:opacity protein-like surface antigen
MRRLALLLLLLVLPQLAVAWRGYPVYTGASFGVQAGGNFTIVSSNPNAFLDEINFDTGFDFSGYFGYSLGDYIVIEGELDFFSMKSDNNYFKPERIITTTGSTVGQSLANNASTTQNSGESLRFVQAGVNAYINLDSGSDFMPYVGVGLGMFLANWSGFHTATVGYQIIGGVDILLVPKMSAFVQIRRARLGDMDFETQHYVLLVDSSGNPVNVIGATYKQERYQDTLKDVDLYKFDLGVRVAF